MKGISKLLMLGGAAIVGILALMLGNNPMGTNTNATSNNPEPTTVLNEEEVEENDIPEDGEPEDDLLASDLNFIPTQVLGDEIIRHKYYTTSYSSKHKNAEWVAYELRNARLFLENAAGRESFTLDPLTDSEANTQDFTNSGYDRGHLVPAFDMNFNKLAMRESCYMINIVPQVPEFNRGIWKSLESTIRNWTKKNKRLYIISGPLLRSNVADAERLNNNPNHPTIPRGFYKIIVDYDDPEKKGIAFMFKNKAIDQPLINFVTTIDRVEEYTGLNFFPDLTKEEELLLEASSNPDLWGMD